MGSAWMIIVAYVLIKTFRTAVVGFVIWKGLPAVLGLSKTVAMRAALIAVALLIIYDLGRVALRFVL